MRLHSFDSGHQHFDNFRIDCGNCCGLCCVALFFSKFDGFPADKVAGKPCRYLEQGFSCEIHEELLPRQMKGCTAYDCFGAGQIATALFGEKNWQANPEIAEEMFAVFIKVFQLQQILWYLTEASVLLPAKSLWPELASCIERLDTHIHSTPDALLQTDIDHLRIDIDPLLRKTTELVAAGIKPAAKPNHKKDFMGHNFKKANLDGQDFSSALLIAANLQGCRLAGCNFLGADMRDANLKNADLSESIFLTQGQINSAKGNQNTRIPESLKRPFTWI